MNEAQKLTIAVCKACGTELPAEESLMASKRLETFLSAITDMRAERLKRGDPLPKLPPLGKLIPYEIKETNKKER